MSKKDGKKKREELDTETTFADMNVEGFRWYDPARKKGKGEAPKLTKKEQRAMIWGAYKAMLPMFACMIAVFIGMFLLVWLWLK